MIRPNTLIKRTALKVMVSGALASVALWTAVPVAHAQVAVFQKPTPWAALTVQQQTFLAPLKSDWTRLDGARQRKWLDVASRSSSWSDAERERAQARMADWARAPADERARTRLAYQEVQRTVAPDARQAQWEAYQALSEERKRELATQATAATRQPGLVAPPQATVKSAVIQPESVTQGTVRSVSPMIVQAQPGVTTTLVTQSATPPLHQQAGMPKLSAKPGFVDPKTLLPKRGMQGAAVAGSTDSTQARQP